MRLPSGIGPPRPGSASPGADGFGPSPGSSKLDDLARLPIRLQHPVPDPPACPPFRAQMLQRVPEARQDRLEEPLTVIKEPGILDEVEVEGHDPHGLGTGLEKPA